MAERDRKPQASSLEHSSDIADRVVWSCLMHLSIIAIGMGNQCLIPFEDLIVEVKGGGIKLQKQVEMILATDYSYLSSNLSTNVQIDIAKKEAMLVISIAGDSAQTDLFLADQGGIEQIQKRSIDRLVELLTARDKVDEIQSRGEKQTYLLPAEEIPSGVDENNVVRVSHPGLIDLLRGVDDIAHQPTLGNRGLTVQAGTHAVTIP